MDTENKFEREKLCFEHNSEQVRHLNTQMNQIPVIAVTLTGGLWYAAGSMEMLSAELKFYLLLFASFCNFCLVFICFRVRDVLESCLEKIESFYPPAFTTGRPKNPILGKYGKNNSMIKTYTLLIIASALLSLAVAVKHYWPFNCTSKTLGTLGILSIFVIIPWCYGTILRCLERGHLTNTKTSVKKYYNNNADQYFLLTKDIDMSALYKKFLDNIPGKGKILDAGSGSGRDTLAFIKLGYDVNAFDVSKKLAKLSSNYTGLKTKVMGFEDLSEADTYDGIWASASLLHLPVNSLGLVFQKMAKSLKNGGALYVSFKHGTQQRDTQDGRHFTDMNEANLSALIAQQECLKIKETWVTDGEGQYKGSGQWFNAILIKH